MKNTFMMIGISALLLTTCFPSNASLADCLVKDYESDSGMIRQYDSADYFEDLFWDTDNEDSGEKVYADSKDGKTVDIKWEDMVTSESPKGKRTVYFYLSAPYKDKNKVYADNPKVSTKYIGKTDYDNLKYTIKGLTPGRHYIVYMKALRNGKTVDYYYFKLSTTVKVPYIDLSQTKTNYAKINGDLRVSKYNYDFNYDDACNCCIQPDAIEYYKKGANGKYRKIGTTAANKPMIDRNVSLGKTYTYKARAYAVINGKKVYSEYSPNVYSSIRIYNLKPKMKISCVDKENNIVMITSDKKNGVVTCRLEKDFLYGTDGKNFKTGDFDYDIKPGKTIYIKLSDPKKRGIVFHDSDNWYHLYLDFNRSTYRFVKDNL